MTLHLELAPEADAELELYRQQYETERKGLGAEFLIEVDRAADQIKQGPLHFEKIPRSQFRRAVMARFPFSLVFRILDDRVRVIAVAPQKKKPRYWRNRS